MKVLYEKKDTTAWITFNRPERLNALDKESWHLLSKYVKAANDDNEIKAIVLTGKGRAFCAGDDIYAMYELNSLDEAKEYFFTLNVAVEELINAKKPIICFVNGLAYGGGCELLLLSDINIALENSKFSIPEARLGLIPAISITIGYKVLGRRITFLLYTGEEIDAYNAKNIGLIDYIVKDDKEAIEAINKIINLINDTSMNSIFNIKKFIRQEKISLKEAIIELASLSQTYEVKQRMKNFIDTRKKLRIDKK